MNKIQINLKDLIKRSKDWGMGFDTKKEADEFVKNPKGENLQIGSLIYMCELLETTMKIQYEILDAHKLFYKEMMKEKELLRKLRK